MKTVDVLIPVYKPPASFAALPDLIRRQSYPVHRVIILETVREGVPGPDLSGFTDAKVLKVDASEFDHGNTRHLGVLESDADYVLFLTQDAEPCDERLIEELMAAFEDDKTAVAYGRQLPKDDCRALERLTRDFNYPAESSVRTADDISRLGIKAFFCSDVCAMYDRAKYLSLNGFVRRTIFNEDMIFAFNALQGGYSVAYRAEAGVKHSHNYSGTEQLRRNFDMGVSQADHPEVFAAVSSESEGLKLVKTTAGRLLKAGRWYLLPQMVWQSGMKYLGYRLGKNYRKLPEKTVLRLTMNRNYWRK